MGHSTRINLVVALTLLGGLAGVPSAASAADGTTRERTAVRVSHGHGQELTIEQIRRALMRSMEGLLRDPRTELRIRVVQPTAPLRLPSGRVDVQAPSVGGDLELGRQSFPVVILVDGRRVHTVEVVADVEVWAELITPIRTINPDETISADDLTLTKLALPSLSHDFARTADEVAGKRASRMLRTQAPIRVGALAQAYAVRKGDHVLIEARRGGLVITASGIIRGGAQVGQSVSVTNQDSGKEVRAKVVGPGVVRVEF